MSPTEIDNYIVFIDLYRSERNYKEADALRQKLYEAGVIVENRNKGASRWRYK